MVDKTVHDELTPKSKSIDDDEQRLPIGMPGHKLACFAGTISKEDGEAMMKAIEEGCENIDWEGWDLTLD
jgi:hypothetical protein